MIPPDLHTAEAARYASDSPQAILASVSASIDLAIHQLGEGRTASAIEILAEAIREANGDPITTH